MSVVYVCARAGSIRVALEGGCVRSVDGADDPVDDVPLLRLADHLGVEAEPAREHAGARRVAIEHAAARVDLLVSEVVRVRRFSAGARHPLPAWIAGLERQVGAMGVLLEDPDLFLLLDPAALVRAATTRE